MNQQEDSLKKQYEYYKDLYEKEHKKCEELTSELVDLEAKNADLTYKLDKIRKSKLWKSIYPFRLAFSHLKNFVNRVRRYGSFKELREFLKV